MVPLSVRLLGAQSRQHTEQHQARGQVLPAGPLLHVGHRHPVGRLLRVWLEHRGPEPFWDSYFGGQPDQLCQLVFCRPTVDHPVDQVADAQRDLLMRGASLRCNVKERL